MAQPFPIRRAAIYRQRAQELSESAKQPRDECDRRHMLDQAATFERAADALAPPPPPAAGARLGALKGSSIHHEFEPMPRKYRRTGAASFISAARDRVDPAEAEQKFAERERREAANTRTKRNGGSMIRHPFSALAAKR